MLNIPKDNRKTFLIITIGLALLIVITIFFDINFFHRTMFYKAEPDLTQYTNTKESNFEENKYELVSEERRLLYYTDEIMAMINNKEFDKLYSILDDGYKELYAKSVAQLEENMKKFSDGEYSMGYSEYYREGNMYLIDVRFEKANLTREDIINGIGQPIDTICIREIEKGKYTVAFNGFISRQKLEAEGSNGLVKIKIKEITMRADSTEILLYIENLTDETITLYEDRLDIYLLHKYADYKYINTNTLSRELAPNEKNIYRARFKNIYCKGARPQELRFEGICGSDGEEKRLKFKFN